MNLRPGACFLGFIEGIVSQFPENHERPSVGGVADLLDQLWLVAEVE
jgi:hypothetical protein